MTRRDIVKQAIAHRETEHTPYCVLFTPEAEDMIRPHFPQGEQQLAIGNFVYQIGPPWWDWHDLPESYKGFDAPDVLPQTRGTGSYKERNSMKPAGGSAGKRIATYS